MRRIELNGLLFGVEPDGAYSVYKVPLEACDRLLFYSDGVSETENAAGEAFGDQPLERIVRNHCFARLRTVVSRCSPNSTPGDLQQRTSRMHYRLSSTFFSGPVHRSRYRNLATVTSLA
jgi:Stage II sporulation protein E (SpoIIE)